MTQLFIYNKNVDLYEDETILYTMAMTDFKNLGKNTAAYTNTFQVPATPANNDLIRHYFNQNNEVSPTFDPRKRLEARIEVDNVVFEKGFCLLTKATFKQEKPANYSFTFYTNDNLVLSYLGDTTLKSLDWSAYDYDVEDPAVTNGGLSGTGNAMNGNDDVIFPLIQLVDTDGAQRWTPDILANSNPQNFKVLRPAIRVNKVFDLIETYLTEHNITFNYNDFGTGAIDFFDSMYMYLPYEYVPEPDASTGYTKTLPIANFTVVPGFNTNQVNIPQNIYNVGVIKSQVAFRSCSITISLDAAADYHFYIIEYASTGGAYSVRSNRQVLIPPLGDIVIEEYLYNKQDNNVNVYFEIYSEFQGNVGGTYELFGSTSNEPTSNLSSTGTGDLGIALLQDVNNNFVMRSPGMKISDFMNSIFKMANLVMYSNDGREYYIATWDNWRTLGQVVQLDQYIDIGEATRTITQNPKTFEFKYEETETILNKEFKNLWGYAYGDLLVYTEGFGEVAEYDVSFNFLLWENIGSETTNDDLLIASSYDASFDSVIDEVSIICWKPGDIKNCNIDFVDWTAPITTYKVASSFYGVDAPTYALVFKDEQNPYTNETLNVSLFRSFYENYYDILLDSNARKFSYKGYVPNAIVSQLFPNDTIRLGDQYFIINKYTHNLTTQEMNIEMLNYQRPLDTPLPTLPDITPPNMGYFTMDCATKVLTWTAATDNIGVTGYKVYRNNVEITDTALLTYTDSAAPTNQKNIYYIKAYDAAGNLSTPSNAIMCWGDIGFAYELNLDLS